MGWAAGVMQIVQGVSQYLQGVQAEINSEKLGGEQGGLYLKFGEFNAANIERQGAEEDRRSFLNNEMVQGMALARAAASGFKLSGTPQDYIDRMKEIYGETMKWHRAAVSQTAEQTREEARLRSDLAIRYGANAGEVDFNRGAAAGLNSISNAFGTYAKLYNPAKGNPSGASRVNQDDGSTVSSPSMNSDNYTYQPGTTGGDYL